MKNIDTEGNFICAKPDNLLKRRKEAREKKDWHLSDKLRDELKEKGWLVEDTKFGQKLKRD